MNALSDCFDFAMELKKNNFFNPSLVLQAAWILVSSYADPITLQV